MFEEEGSLWHKVVKNSTSKAAAQLKSAEYFD
jgi:hypothetical protein